MKKEPPVFAYGRGGMITYSLDSERGVVIVDQASGRQELDYGGFDTEHHLPGCKADPNLAFGGWLEAVSCALKRLKADGWPLDR